MRGLVNAVCARGLIAFLACQQSDSDTPVGRNVPAGNFFALFFVFCFNEGQTSLSARSQHLALQTFHLNLIQLLQYHVRSGATKFAPVFACRHNRCESAHSLPISMSFMDLIKENLSAPYIETCFRVRKACLKPWLFFTPFFVTTNTFKFSLFPRTVEEWNLLPATALSSVENLEVYLYRSATVPNWSCCIVVPEYCPIFSFYRVFFFCHDLIFYSCFDMHTVFFSLNFFYFSFTQSDVYIQLLSCHSCLGFVKPSALNKYIKNTNNEGRALQS